MQFHPHIPSAVQWRSLHWRERDHTAPPGRFDLSVSVLTVKLSEVVEIIEHYSSHNSPLPLSSLSPPDFLFLEIVSVFRSTKSSAAGRGAFRANLLTETRVRHSGLEGRSDSRIVCCS